MINNLRYELSFKNISQLENKLNFCKFNKIKNINIPCKGNIKKELFSSTIKYISRNFPELNVTYHYSLYHQYSLNIEKSYQDFFVFLKNSCSNRNYEILLVSGSNKKKNFDSINVLTNIKKEKTLKVKLGIAYNPYLEKYYKVGSERERLKSKISSGLINSIWFQYGTDIKVLNNEFTYLKKSEKYKKLNLFGSLLIPSKQFLARFKFRPWKEVYISENCLYSLDEFADFTRDLVCFYKSNNITPVIETDFSSPEKLNYLYSFFRK
ncbi:MULTISPECIES: hypothetical protein [Prochlorococcus]|uniref:Putative Paired amphipathic helix repeat n=1 Tax=Prochlorococcus marinus str. MIT 9116 TaxID=167544 RepID=A0A0A1ZQR2_PROMR|nr:hypothetical protein [Prochlorococcus marinus]KGF89477.1 putative Paired amphipathic helix repeat [Prochlorococcus marinus str. MIT 9107]KGF90513.1 putative Paired amphipathic helix repeat [Prochlorococcus marinus str. MIT 9116]KGF92992.1 putative Paired amphipathic helix repeat [Prochlorococcus marinus str. MIT 9123]